MDLFGVCVSKCPHMGEVICTDKYLIDNQKAKPQDLVNCFNTEPPKVCDSCWLVPLNTSSVLYRCMYEVQENQTATEFCVFPENITLASDPNCLSKKTIKTTEELNMAKNNPVIDQLLHWKTRITGWIGDCISTFPYILLFGVLLPIVGGFIYIVYF